MKRALKIALLTVAALLVVLVGGSVLAYFLVDLDKLVNEQVATAKPEIEAKLGRKVEIGHVSTRFFPVLGGRIEKVAVASDPTRPEDDRPLVQVDAVGFDVALWKALLSGGRQVVISGIYVDGLKVNLVRAKDGRLSYQDILDRQAAAPAPAEAKADEPLSPAVQEYLQRLSISEIRLADAEIRLVDHATATGVPAESFVRKLNVRLQDVRLTDPIRAHLDAAVFSDATNFVFEASVGPLPADLKLAGVPRVDLLKLKVDDVDLSRLAAYLPAESGGQIDSATVSADWSLEGLGPDRPCTVSGFFALGGLQLRGGQRLDVRLDSKARFDPATMSATIEQLTLRAGQIELFAKGELLDLAGTPRFKDFRFGTVNLELGTLLAYVPALKQGLPPGSRIQGPLVAEVVANGDAAKQTVQARVELSGADLMLPETFLKPKGVPLALHLDGEFTSADAQLRRLQFALGELDVKMSGTVKDFANPRFDLLFDSKPFSLDAMARLLPSIEKSLAESKAKASGDGKLAGHLKGTQEKIDAALAFSMLGMQLQVPGTELQGDLRFTLGAQGNPAKDFGAQLLFDASSATIRVEDALEKAAGTPMRFEASVTRAGERIDLKKVELAFAELRLAAAGGLDLAKGTSDIRVEMPRLDLEKFAKTVTAIPAQKAKGGYVDARLAVRGNPRAPETMEATLDPLQVRLGRSDLRGQMRVTNLLKPKVILKLSSTMLDLDELNPPQEPAAPAQPTATRAQEAKDDPSLKDYGFTGVFDLKTVIVSKTELQSFRGDVRLADGLLKLEDCTFGVFGGSVTAKGTEAEIWKGRMPFKANLTAKGIDLNQALSAKTRYANTLYGKADLSTQVAGEGFETRELEEKLVGELRVAITEGRFARGNLTQAITGGALAGLPGITPKALSGENAIRNLDAHFLIKDGKLELTKPVTFQLDGARTTLDGAIGIAGKLFLRGQYFMPPASVAKMTANQCSSAEELPVPLLIGGTVDAPNVVPDGKGLTAALAARCLKGSAANLAGKVLGKQASQAVNAATDTKAAEAKAREELEKQRLAAEAKAREEAERQKAAAKKKLEEKAGGLFKNMLKK